jgi:hypothetical protein
VAFAPRGIAGALLGWRDRFRRPGPALPASMERGNG